jgi:hypothetical protein
MISGVDEQAMDYICSLEGAINSAGRLIDTEVAFHVSFSL